MVWHRLIVCEGGGEITRVSPGRNGASMQEGVTPSSFTTSSLGSAAEAANTMLQCDLSRPFPPLPRGAVRRCCAPQTFGQTFHFDLMLITAGSWTGCMRHSFFLLLLLCSSAQAFINPGALLRSATPKNRSPSVTQSLRMSGEWKSEVAQRCVLLEALSCRGN